MTRAERARFLGLAVVGAVLLVVAVVTGNGCAEKGCDPDPAPVAVAP